MNSVENKNKEVMVENIFWTLAWIQWPVVEIGFEMKREA